VSEQQPESDRRPPVVLRYEEHWPDLLGQLAADQAFGRSPSGARELVKALLDDGSFVEAGSLVRREQQSYEGGGVEDELEHLEQGQAPGQIPGDALVGGWGTVAGRQVFVLADDAELGGPVRGAGAAGKAARVREWALRQGRPLVQMLATVRLPPGEFIGTEFGQIGYGVDFPYEFASTGQIPKAALVYGPLTAQAAFEAAAAHLTILAGPDARLGLSADQDERGLADYTVGTPDDALPLIRLFLSYLPDNCWEAPPDEPPRPPRAGAFPSLGGPADPRRVIELVVDGGELFELRRGQAPELVTGLARIEGRALGIAAGGGLTADGCRKLARMVRFCDAFRLPILNLLGDLELPAVAPPYAGAQESLALLAALRACSVPQIVVLTGPSAVALPGPQVAFLGRWSDERSALPSGGGVPLAPEETRAVVGRVLKRVRTPVVPPWADPRVNRGRTRRRMPAGS
jgi:acetyl-CoA carboxylase carboxyltransferase component